MSRRKKSRSLKNNHSGLKTGSKERMKIESKQRKAAKKEANPRKVNRQRSVYQQQLDKSGHVESQHVGAKAPTAIQAVIKKTLPTSIDSMPATAIKRSKPKPAPVLTPAPQETETLVSEDPWDLLESPQNKDIF
jgi:hypothetical protein